MLRSRHSRTMLLCRLLLAAMCMAAGALRCHSQLACSSTGPDSFQGLFTTSVMSLNVSADGSSFLNVDKDATFYVHLQLGPLMVVNIDVDDSAAVEQWELGDLNFVRTCIDVYSLDDESMMAFLESQADAGGTRLTNDPTTTGASPTTGGGAAGTSGVLPPVVGHAVVLVATKENNQHLNPPLRGNFTLAYVLRKPEGETLIQPAYSPDLPKNSFAIYIGVSDWDMALPRSDAVRLETTISTTASPLSMSAENWAGSKDTSSSLKRLFAQFVQLLMANMVSVKLRTVTSWVSPEVHTGVEDVTKSPIVGTFNLRYPLMDAKASAMYRAAIMPAEGVTTANIIAIVAGVLSGVCFLACMAGVIVWVYKKHPELRGGAQGEELGNDENDENDDDAQAQGQGQGQGQGQAVGLRKNFDYSITDDDNSSGPSRTRATTWNRGSRFGGNDKPLLINSTPS